MFCRRSFVVASVIAVAAFSLLAAGCGGGSSPGVANVASSATITTVSPSTSGSTEATGLVAFASCMRSHGVPNFPDPDSSGGIPKQAAVSAFQAVSKSQADAAQNACNHLLPAGGSLSGQAVQTITAQDRQDYLKAAACMRSHGFPGFPDPKFQNNNAHVNIPPSVNQNSSQFTRVATMCTKLIPAGLPGSHRGTP
jgi:cyclopropane fatty-acyl-phospholipid synthase-like methyltransferase